MMKIIPLSIVCILFFAGQPLLLMAQAPLSKVVGVVWNGEGQGVEAATILLRRQTDRSIVRTVVTNHSGGFEFSRLRQGSYFLSVTMVGYTPYNSGVITVDSTTSALTIPDIVLSPAPKDLKTASVVSQITSCITTSQSGLD